jgi:hypothetical protein
MDQQFTDTFLSWCEAGDCTAGINIQGNAATGGTTGNVDVHIQRCILDTSRMFGLFINNLAASGTIDVEGLYCGPSSAAPSGAAAVYVQNSGGSVSISNGQLLLNVSTTARGIVVDNSSGVRVSGTQITEATASPVVLSVAKNCEIRPIINNAGVTGLPAIEVSGASVANVIAPFVKGKSGAFSKGIDVVGTADARNEYSMTGVDSSCITGGAANKLVRNAVQITATGLSGSNLVSGVMT